MTTSSRYARIGPVAWLILQGVATVASILLAFGIDAWWDKHNETAQKNAMLESVRKEMLSALEYIDGQCTFRRASLHNVNLLLRAAAAGRYEDEERTLERRLADLLWYSDVRFSTGAHSSLLSSGLSTAIQDLELREYIADYPRMAAMYSAYGSRDESVVLEIVAPFLNRHTSLLQLNNESFRFGRPGTGSGADPTQVVPVAELTDHTSLLGNREFQGVLVQKMWIDLDVESTLCTDVAREIDKAVRLIDRETANSS